MKPLALAPLMSRCAIGCLRQQIFERIVEGFDKCVPCAGSFGCRGHGKHAHARHLHSDVIFTESAVHEDERNTDVLRLILLCASFDEEVNSEVKLSGSLIPSYK